MPYATREDIEKVYGTMLLRIVADLTDDGIAEDDAITQALAESSSEIDSYLALRHVLPLDPVPPILIQLCRDMAVYRLSLQAGPRTTEMRTRYMDAIAFLEKVAAGKVTLVQIPGDTDGDGDVDEDDTTTGEVIKASPYVVRIVRSD